MVPVMLTLYDSLQHCMKAPVSPAKVTAISGKYKSTLFIYVSNVSAPWNNHFQAVSGRV